MSATTSVDLKSLAKNPPPSSLSGAGCWGSLAVIGLSLFLFLLACATPAMIFDKETWLGIQVLALGWQGIFLGQFAWFANPFWFLSLMLVSLRRWLLTFAAALVSLLIALDALSFVGATVPLDEGFVNSMIFKSYHVGFYLWLASLAAVGLGAAVMWVVSRRVARRS